MDLGSASPATTATKWGDRVARRRDILRAASELLEREGFDRFHIRAIARGAGVSAATLYSYFPNKLEIFATLMQQRFAELRVEVERLDGEATRSVEALVVRVMPELVDMYRHFGRHIHDWADATERDSRAHATSRTAFVEATAALEAALRRAAANEGLELDDDPVMMPFVWSTLFGLADHYCTNMHGTLGYSRRELTRYAARSLARGLRRAPGARP